MNQAWLSHCLVFLHQGNELLSLLLNHYGRELAMEDFMEPLPWNLLWGVAEADWTDSTMSTGSTDSSNCYLEQQPWWTSHVVKHHLGVHKPANGLLCHLWTSCSYSSKSAPHPTSPGMNNWPWCSCTLIPLKLPRHGHLSFITRLDTNSMGSHFHP